MNRKGDKWPNGDKEQVYMGVAGLKSRNWLRKCTKEYQEIQGGTGNVPNLKNTKIQEVKV